MTQFYKWFKEAITKRSHLYRWKGMLWTAMMLAAFLTTYFLILPAITVENKTADDVAIKVESPPETPPATTVLQTKEVAITTTQAPQTELPATAQPSEEASAVKYLDKTLEHRGKDYTVKVKVGQEAKIAEQAQLSVKELTEQEAEFASYETKAKQEIGGEIERVRLYDISLLVDGKEVEPQAPVQVEINYDQDLTVKDEDMKIVHFKDDGQVEVLASKDTAETKATNSDVAFKTASFSVYAIVQQDGKVKPIHTYRFENVDGTPYHFLSSSGRELNEQKVKDGESIKGVGIPEVTPDATKHYHFDGWFVYDAASQTYKEEVVLNTLIKVTETKDILVRPKYSQVVQVTFFDNEQGTVVLQKEQVTLENGTGYLDLTDFKATAPSATQAFEGWSLAANGPIISDAQANHYPVTKDIQLYPKFREAKRIDFETGDIDKGAPYIAPAYVFTGETAIKAKPANPVWQGYIFDGWEAPDGKTFDFSKPLTQNITLKAKWRPDKATYTVVYWQQSITDDKNAPANQKKYEYAGQETRTATVGNRVYLTTADTSNARYKGFKYTSFKGETSATVAADGSTVLNVYFDRQLITMQFYKSYSQPGPTSRVWDDSSRVGTYTGLYGTSLSDNGYNWPQGNAWRYYDSNGNTRGMSFLGSFILPDGTYPVTGYDEDTIIRLIPTRAADKEFRFYKQDLDGNYSDQPSDIGSSTSLSGRFSFTDKYTGFTVDQYRLVNRRTGDIGDWEWASVDGRNGTNFVDIRANEDLEIHYRRKEYDLHYLDPFDDTDLVNFNAKGVKYESPLTSYQPDTSQTKPTPKRPGYRWDGKWYKDKNRAEVFDWNSQMPDHDVKVYAGWEPIRYQVTIDPNGGELPDGKPLYFKVNYGEKVPSYTQITRNYVEDPAGTFYYKLTKDKEAETDQQYAKYTQKAGEADVDTTKTYRQEGDVYRLVGWYLLNKNGDPVRPYRFSEPVVGDVHIRAIWRRAGEYGVIYSEDAVDPQGKPLKAKDGSQVKTSDNPVDPETYGDQSGAEMMKRPTIPNGYRFRGWYYNGKLYSPNDPFIIQASLADKNKKITIRPALVPISELDLKDTELNYDGNGGNREEVDAHGNKQTVTKTKIRPLNPNDTLKTEGNTYFTRPGYDLIGWHTDKTKADAGTVQFKPNEEIGVDNEHPVPNVLYAVWKPKIYTITVTKKVVGLEEDKQRVFDFVTSLPAGNFQLKHGEKKTYQIAYGTTFTLSEQSTPDFEASEKISYRNHASGQADKTEVVDSTQQIKVESDMDIVFTNTRKQQRVKLQKVSVENLNQTLKGANFDLYAQTSQNKKASQPLLKGLVSDNQGALNHNGQQILTLPVGTYYLTETKAPDGYNLAKADIILSVTDTGVSLKQDGNMAQVDKSQLVDGVPVFAFKVTNSKGIELPNTGGIGQGIFVLAGLVLVLPATYLLYKRKEIHE